MESQKLLFRQLRINGCLPVNQEEAVLYFDRNVEIRMDQIDERNSWFELYVSGRRIFLGSGVERLIEYLMKAL